MSNLNQVFVSVILCAGGNGKRMKHPLKKQFIQVAEIPILELSLKRFQEHIHVSEIILVLPEDEIATYSYLKKNYSKVNQICAGGEERQDSVMNGLQYCSEKSDIILVHDGVRPFVSIESIDQVIQGLEMNDVVALGYPAINTIKIVKNGIVIETPPRHELWEMQTPQGMKAELFRILYDKAKTEKIIGTDEAMIAEYYQFPVLVVKGNRENIKITTEEDLLFAEILYKRLFHNSKNLLI